ncbi:MAG: signal peptidase I [Oscillospiraceae bacterium]|nr:signal peptidase I [Oscillospiraceae bacterium]
MSRQKTADKPSNLYIYRAADHEPIPRIIAGKTRKSKKSELRHECLMLVIRIIIILIILSVVFTILFGFYYNLDWSMNPSIREGDLIIYSRIDRNYIAKDLLLLEYMGEKQIRRVVAVSGDSVDISEAGLIINGALQQEQYIFHHTSRYAESIEFPLVLAESEVFLLGDFRDQVTDSRFYGPVVTSVTLGKVVAVIRRRNL